MKRIILTYLFLVLFLALALVAQVPSPVANQTGTILLMNATAHLGNGEIIENSAVAFKDGKLTVVADANVIKLDKAAFDTIISLQGKHIYPGFIAPNSTLGLFEIGAVRATRDFREVGSINPNVRSIIAYNTDSKITPTVRSNGVLLAQITPKGGRVSGTSSIVELEGWNWEDAVYKIDDGLHINWPRFHNSSGWWGNPGPSKVNEKYDEQYLELKTLFNDAKAYSEVGKHEESDLKLKSMRGVFDGSKQLYIHVHSSKGIEHAIDFSKSAGIKKMVIVGGTDAWMVTDLLKEHNIPVIVRRIHSLPQKMDDDIDLPFRLPAMLKEAGVLFCLENSGDMETMGTRNLPFYAGTAAAYGLTKEEALMSITSNTAKILGIDKTVGSLEVGKDATLIISTGDALDVLTNNIEYAFIRGKGIDLDNHQKQLYRKFKSKYEDQ